MHTPAKMIPAILPNAYNKLSGKENSATRPLKLKRPNNTAAVKKASFCFLLDCPAHQNNRVNIGASSGQSQKVLKKVIRITANTLTTLFLICSNANSIKKHRNRVNIIF